MKHHVNDSQNRWHSTAVLNMYLKLMWYNAGIQSLSYNYMSSQYTVGVLETKPHEKAFFEQQLAQHKQIKEVTFFDTTIAEVDPQQLAQCDIISSFVFSAIGTAELDSMPDLKLIATRSTGYDHIALEATKQQDIVVANVPTYGANTVAEHTFALLLSLSRKVPQSIERTRSGDFSREGLEGFDLCHKTIGVVGTGSIGRQVIRIAHGFGMTILAYDLHEHQDIIDTYGVAYHPLEDLLAQSDVVTLHVPYIPQTHHLLNKETMQHIKHGAYIINTARGELIDTDTLLEHLANKTIAGAGLDVLEGERLIKDEVELLTKDQSQDTAETLWHDHMLIKMDNVIVTPHNAFNSVEALARINQTTCDNIIAFVEGREQNIVS